MASQRQPSIFLPHGGGPCFFMEWTMGPPDTWNKTRSMKDHPVEVLVTDGKHEVLEGDPIEGMVIVKFPSVKAAKDWCYSEAYQNVAKHRKHGAIYHGLIVEGVS